MSQNVPVDQWVLALTREAKADLDTGEKLGAGWIEAYSHKLLQASRDYDNEGALELRRELSVLIGVADRQKFPLAEINVAILETLVEVADATLVSIKPRVLALNFQGTDVAKLLYACDSSPTLRVSELYLLQETEVTPESLADAISTCAKHQLVRVERSGLHRTANGVGARHLILNGNGAAVVQHLGQLRRG